MNVTPPDYRIGNGHDIHRLYPNHELWLGGILIDSAKAGFKTHSDGDVLSHAIVDALAGAIADGDLGTHFPEDDPLAENARSIEFVREFMHIIHQRGYEIENIDSFITLGTTRLQPYVSKIARELAIAIGIDRSRVSVKARSNDGIGPEGRGEAASATVTILLRRSQTDNS